MVKVEEESLLISPKDIKPSSKYLEVIGTLNPGATRLPNGDIILYIRVLEKLKKTEDGKYLYSPRMEGEDKYKLKIDKFKKELIDHSSDLDFIFKDGTKRLTFISHLRRVILDKSGFRVKSIESKPSFFGLAWDGELGIEDSRITKIGELYIMTYVCLSRSGNVSTSYAISNDCINWYRRGIIFREQNKDVVIFPELVKNNYVAFDRPEGSFEFTHAHMWTSYSKDLEFWGDSKPFIISQNFWDSGKVGAGPPPIRIDGGWLFIYHGVIDPGSSKMRERILKRMDIFELFSEQDTIYCVGGVLLDLKNPTKVIARSKVPLLVPLKKYEIGSFEDKGVIFPTGMVKDLDNEHILLFCGAGDRVTTVKKLSIEKVMKKLREN